MSSTAGRRIGHGNRRLTGRRPDLSSAASLIPLTGLLALSVGCLYVAALGVTAALDAAVGWRVRPVWLVVGYLLIGGLMFVRPVERVIAGWYFRARRPTAEERQRLDAAWGPVASAAGVPARRYILRVQDSAHLNASAQGGHVIAVTSATLHRLPDAQLRGIIAHELGHHLGLHAVVAAVAAWLLLPIRAWFLLSALVVRLLAGLVRMTSALRNGPAGFVAFLFAWLLNLANRLFSVVTRFVLACLAAVGRRGEHAADAAAVRLGFGWGLLLALRGFAAAGPPERGRNLKDLFGATHPPLHERIRRVTAQLDDTRRR